MKYLPKPENKILVHWTYSPGEWSNFLRCSFKQKGFLLYIIHLAISPFSKSITEVKITRHAVSIGNALYHFSTDSHLLRKIDLRDEDRQNILAITYDRLYGNRTSRNEIRVPIPRGKLKEAVQIQESLSPALINPQLV